MNPSLQSITSNIAIAFRQQQLSSENARLTLQNDELEQENGQLQNENATLRQQQQRLDNDNRHLQQRVGDLRRELTATSDTNNTPKNTAATPATTSLDVYA